MSTLTVYGTALESRFFLGSAGYPSPQVLTDSIVASGAQVVTVGLKRPLAAAGDNGFVAGIVNSGVRLLPNTAGCRTAREASHPGPHGARAVRHHLDQARSGGRRTHPAARPLGHGGGRGAAGQGRFRGLRLLHRRPGHLPAPAGRRLRAADALGRPHRLGPGPDQPVRAAHPARGLPGVPLVVDAGIGAPSHAARAMELGFDAVLLNSAVSQAVDPVRMARAFGLAIEAGRAAFEAGVMAPQDMGRGLHPRQRAPLPDRMNKTPILWSIAGTDSGGGAGLLADLRAADAFGVHLCPVVAAVTAQSTTEVARIDPVAPEQLEAQLAALADDMRPAVIKRVKLKSAEWHKAAM